MMLKPKRRRELVDLGECVLVLVLVIVLAAFAGRLPARDSQQKGGARAPQAAQTNKS
jgi:hypothetical protein